MMVSYKDSQLINQLINLRFSIALLLFSKKINNYLAN